MRRGWPRDSVFTRLAPLYRFSAPISKHDFVIRDDMTSPGGTEAWRASRVRATAFMGPLCVAGRQQALAIVYGRL